MRLFRGGACGLDDALCWLRFGCGAQLGDGFLDLGAQGFRFKNVGTEIGGDGDAGGCGAVAELCA
jgi:hypothetical protein